MSDTMRSSGRREAIVASAMSRDIADNFMIR
jgi:hypothetical protein